MIVALSSTAGTAAGAAAPVCATCHPKETARYLKSAMGTSLTPPAPLPAGRITHSGPDAILTTEQRNGRMVHGITEQGLTAEYPIRYQIGGGLMGRTYMVQRGDYLFESPVSWYNSSGWDLSPGYGHGLLIDFDRPMEEQCLFCHAGPTQFVDPDRRRLKNPQLTSITCERCHGESEAHVRHPSAKNILNPAKMGGPVRDSICEQCHLEGANRTLNPGKNWSDFRPGEPAENTFATYILKGGSSASVRAVSQVEQLAQSKCVRATAGKLWCGTCHNPHGEVANRQHEILAICTSCHVTLSAAAHPAGQAECTSCHMPRKPTTDIAHAALTDHRILRRPAGGDKAAEGEPVKVTAWREPPSNVQDRDLGVAEVVIGFAQRLQAVGDDGVRLLEAMPAERRREDFAVVSDFEGFALEEQDFEQAAELGRRAVELAPQSARAAMNLGIVLNKSGDTTEAERELNRAIDLDPSLKQAYMELATLYSSHQRLQEATETVARYLRWNPRDIMFRLQKARLLR